MGQKGRKKQTELLYKSADGEQCYARDRERQASPTFSRDARGQGKRGWLQVEGIGGTQPSVFASASALCAGRPRLQWGQCAGAQMRLCAVNWHEGSGSLLSSVGFQAPGWPGLCPLSGIPISNQMLHHPQTALVILCPFPHGIHLLPQHRPSLSSSLPGSRLGSSSSPTTAWAPASALWKLLSLVLLWLSQLQKTLMASYALTLSVRSPRLLPAVQGSPQC